jgi:hypothetical protein
MFYCDSFPAEDEDGDDGFCKDSSHPSARLGPRSFLNAQSVPPSKNGIEFNLPNTGAGDATTGEEGHGPTESTPNTHPSTETYSFNAKDISTVTTSDSASLTTSPGTSGPIITPVDAMSTSSSVVHIRPAQVSPNYSAFIVSQTTGNLQQSSNASPNFNHRNANMMIPNRYPTGATTPNLPSHREASHVIHDLGSVLLAMESMNFEFH